MLNIVVVVVVVLVSCTIVVVVMHEKESSRAGGHKADDEQQQSKANYEPEQISNFHSLFLLFISFQKMREERTKLLSLI